MKARHVALAVALAACRTAPASQPAPPAAAAEPGRAMHAGMKHGDGKAHGHGHGEHAQGDGHGQHGPGHHANHPGGVDHTFKDAKAWAEVFDAPDRDGWQKPDEVVRLLALAPGQVVVDVGAGTGYFEGRLAAAVGPRGKVIATDVEPDMVTYLRDRALREGWTNVVAQHTPPDDPQLGAASVDRILVVDVWHHLPDPAAYAAHLAAALRPGGVIAVVDFTRESEMGPPVEMRVDAATIVTTLRAAGLRAEVAAESLPNQYVVLGRR